MPKVVPSVVLPWISFVMRRIAFGYQNLSYRTSFRQLKIVRGYGGREGSYGPKRVRAEKWCTSRIVVYGPKHMVAHKYTGLRVPASEFRTPSYGLRTPSYGFRTPASEFVRKLRIPEFGLLKKKRHDTDVITQSTYALR